MRTNFFPTRQAFVVDPQSITRLQGRQVDWPSVPERFRSTAVKVALTAQANAAATSLTVTALLAAIPKGSLIDFGTTKLARASADVAVGATAVPVDAIPTQINSGDVGYYAGSGPKIIPAGTVVAELTSGKVIPRADIPTVRADATVGTTVGNGDGVMTLASPKTGPNVQGGIYTVRITKVVSNLGDFIVVRPDGTVDGYGTVGTAYVGDIRFTIADGSTDFALNTYIPVTVTLTHKTIGIGETEMTEGMPSDAKSGYGIIIGGALWENLLPDATGSPKVLPSAYKTELQTAGVGTGFAFDQYGDNRS